MLGIPRTRREGRAPWRLASATVLVAAASAASAQPCSPALPAPDTTAAAGSGPKFRLIAQLCPELAETKPARRAEQLALFDHTATVTISWPGAPTTTATVATTPAPVDATPLGPEGERVVALAPALLAAAKANDIDPLLLHAIAHVESRHNPQAVSPAGARGLMQMMPATAQRFGVADERSLFDPETNLRASAALLRQLLSRYGNDLRLVLAAYNAGEGAVAKAGGDVPPYPETQAYVRDVLAIYRRLSSSFTVSASGTLVARGSQS
jgi:soluble lytic murein transglycosylase-like protein